MGQRWGIGPEGGEAFSSWHMCRTILSILRGREDTYICMYVQMEWSCICVKMRGHCPLWGPLYSPIYQGAIRYRWPLMPLCLLLFKCGRLNKINLTFDQVTSYLTHLTYLTYFQCVDPDWNVVVDSYRKYIGLFLTQ